MRGSHNTEACASIDSYPEFTLQNRFNTTTFALQKSLLKIYAKPLKASMLKGIQLNYDIKDICPIELSENYPGILGMLNSIRNWKMKFSRVAIANSHQG